jgi:hypothetical protein
MNIEDDEILLNQYVNVDKSKSVVFIASNGTKFFKKPVPIKFRGLDENAIYTFEFNGNTFEKSGAYLMNVGIPTYVRGVDYNKIILINKK